MINNNSFEQDIFEAQIELLHDLETITELDGAAMAILQSIMKFYDGDWAGILSVDLKMKLWKLCWWFSKEGGPFGKTFFDPIEETSIFSRWQEALMRHEPVILLDCEDVRESNPEEYYFLKANKVENILAVPFYADRAGCVLVRNPKRHSDRCEYLFLLWRMIADLMGKKKVNLLLAKSDQKAKESSIPCISINLLGQPCMDVRGTLITSPPLLAWESIYYLHEHPYENFTAKALCEVIQPLKVDIKRAPKTLRESLSELTDAFANTYGNKESLILSSRSDGYRINSKLKIVYDYELFREYLDKAERSKNMYDRVENLQHALDLYRGQLFNGNAESPDLLYDMQILNSTFLEATEHFLRLLMDMGWHTKAITYASHGLRIEHSYPFFYAVYIAAQILVHQHKGAGITLSYAKQALNPEEMKEMIDIIHKYLPEWEYVDQLDNELLDEE